MQIENERPAHHPGKIFPLTACFGDAARGTLGYYLIHSVKQQKDGTIVLVSEREEKNFYAMPLNPDPGAAKVFEALMQDYMAGQIGDLTDARLEKLGPDSQPKAEPLYEKATVVAGKGIYLGIWEPQSDRGQGAVLDIYAAPEDIKDDSGARLLATFNNAVATVARLKDFHGYDGGSLCDTRDITAKAFSDPAALSEWFIPTRQFLDIMHGLRHKGAFSGSFSEGGSMLSGRDWYHGCARWYNCGRNFGSDSESHYFDKYNKKAYTRPIRAELRQGTLAEGPA